MVQSSPRSSVRHTWCLVMPSPSFQESTNQASGCSVSRSSKEKHVSSASRVHHTPTSSAGTRGSGCCPVAAAAPSSTSTVCCASSATRIRLPWKHGALPSRSEEHTSELQSRGHLVCRLLLEKQKNMQNA